MPKTPEATVTVVSAFRRSPALIQEARGKVGGDVYTTKDATLNFTLALAWIAGRNLTSVSDSTFDKCDWNEVARQLSLD